LVTTVIGVAVGAVLAVLIVKLVRHRSDPARITDDEFDEADRRLGVAVPLDDADRERARHDFQEWLSQNEDPGDSEAGVDE